MDSILVDIITTSDYIGNNWYASERFGVTVNVLDDTMRVNVLAHKLDSSEHNGTQVNVPATAFPQ